MPTTNPTEYLRQYSADEEILSHHPLRLHGGQSPVPLVAHYYCRGVDGSWRSSKK